MPAELGQEAPDFELRDQNGDPARLSDPDHCVAEAYRTWGEKSCSALAEL